ncbi:hypothetical protein FHL15_001144 [Xylaria flabelliformis]|uniref:Heterokaryon incompatibility domain-containing protein n=1 Tax=Xylaria flabelliformis TaxID=2512241 RepID=A0A553ICK4_9PEZI|nr:hypothetical protein FHL15_001144 [Xylaria flabelliformis]
MESSLGLVVRADPEGIATWPRRLLHLPSYSSLEWQPGHAYGEHQRPKYNAISYTWGRFRLDTMRGLNEALRKVKGIEIDNCSWTVPPIDPTRFTVDEFRMALQTAAASDRSETYLECDSCFVWLDVACIDQNADAGMLEIGRQAAIFRGAQKVYIWLTDFSSSRLEKIFSDIVDTSHRLLLVLEGSSVSTVEEMGESIEILDTMQKALDDLCNDPWFSSLWTLQEAFLCPHACFMSRDGQVISRKRLTNLLDLCELAWIINEATEYLIAHFPAPIENHPWLQRCEEIGSIIKEKGLLVLRSQNPMLLYSAAGKRTATEDHDYIYGIQQIFDFRLGNSAEAAIQRVYNRYELQVQLGEQLLKKYPVESQMHIFSEPVKDQNGWCICMTSRIPQEDGWMHMGHLMTQKLISECTLGLYRSGSRAIGQFSGKACSFAEFQRAACNEVGPMMEIGEGFSIALDAIRQGPQDEPLEYRTCGAMKDQRCGKEQIQLAEWLQSCYDGSTFIVLLLGRHGNPFFDKGTWFSERSVGLLLVNDMHKVDSQAYWKRIGFVVWDKEVHGLIKEWDYASGLFG